MRFRFLHCADVHLGKHRNTGGERYLDYFRALDSVVEYALADAVDAVLIAGDLFDSQEPDAETVILAAQALRPLRDHAVPVFAIEGNHDRRKRGEQACALDILATEGYLKVLRPGIASSHLDTGADAGNGADGAVQPCDGVTIIGLGFQGHAVEETLHLAHAQRSVDTCNIVMAHAMIALGDAEFDYGVCRYNEIADLHDRIAYLALGHRHTRAGLDDRFGGWIFNPGALEFVNLLDYRQPQDLRGFFDVCLTSCDIVPPAGEWELERLVQSDAYRLQARHVPTRKRPAVTIRVDVTGCAEPRTIVDAVASGVESFADPALRGQCPIIVIRLEGTPSLPQSRLPISEIAERVQMLTNAVHVDVLDSGLYADASPELRIDAAADPTHIADRARGIAADMLRLAGIADGRQDELAALLLELKNEFSAVPVDPTESQLSVLSDRLRPFVPEDGA